MSKKPNSHRPIDTIQKDIEALQNRISDGPYFFESGKLKSLATAITFMIHQGLADEESPLFSWVDGTLDNLEMMLLEQAKVLVKADLDRKELISQLASLCRERTAAQEAEKSDD